MNFIKAIYFYFKQIVILLKYVLFPNKQNGAQTDISDSTFSNSKAYICFTQVSSIYDSAFDVTFFGIHRIWRNKMIRKLKPTENTKLLDMAGGTGSMAFCFLEYIKANNIEKGCSVTVCDINPHMLATAKKRSEQEGYKLINWEQCDCENMPFKNDSFDACTMGFGLRHMNCLDLALKEAYRVLRPGSRFLALEVGHVNNPFLRFVYNFFIYFVFKTLTTIVFPYKGLYDYFIESIRNLPTQEYFKREIEKAGFRQVTYENFLGGLAVLYYGIK